MLTKPPALILTFPDALILILADEDKVISCAALTTTSFPAVTLTLSVVLTVIGESAPSISMPSCLRYT